jgi:hypothetical protein
MASKLQRPPNFHHLRILLRLRPSPDVTCPVDLRRGNWLAESRGQNPRITLSLEKVSSLLQPL